MRRNRIDAMTQSKDLRRIVQAIKRRDAVELQWAHAYCTELIRKGDPKSGRLWRRVLTRVTEARTVRGRATGKDETFDFAIEPVGGGFALSIRFSGGTRENVTGAGVWPSVEKAKEIAEASARLLDSADVYWDAPAPIFPTS
jgi:hypothetical protein